MFGIGYGFFRRIKDISFEQLARSGQEILLYGGQNPGIQQRITRIPNGVGRMEGKGEEMKKGEEQKEREDENVCF